MKKYELATLNNEIRILDYKNRKIYGGSHHKHEYRGITFENSRKSEYKYYPNIIITDKMFQTFISEDITNVKMIEEILLNKINENNTNI